jgi:hypothetical protein
VEQGNAFAKGTGESGLDIEGLLRRSARIWMDQAIARNGVPSGAGDPDGGRPRARTDPQGARPAQFGRGLPFFPGTAVCAQVADRGRLAPLAVSTRGIVGTDASGAVRPPGRGGQGAFSGRAGALESRMGTGA